jgi:hypothetical protein
MLIPTYTTRRFEAQVFTAAGFIGAQLLTYVGTLLIGFSLLPGALNGLDPAEWLRDVLLLAAPLAIFFGLHEALVYGVWRAVSARLNTGWTEFERISGVERKRDGR